MIGAALGALGAAAAATGGYLGWRKIAARGFDRWLPEYARSIGRRGDPRPGDPVRAFVCIADHYEPKLGGAPPAQADERVRRWVDEYPGLFGEFRDDNGRPPRHSFFFPAEEYDPHHLDALAGLCRRGFGEVEIHLHHDDDTSDNLRRTLGEFKNTLANRHGLLARHRDTGDVGYAFIHGNWALDNCRPDGRWCGVNDELDVLRQTGCYVDMTLPSFPSPTQTRTINQIYWAVDDPLRPKSHDRGVPFGAPRPDNSLLMVQGPLLLDWSRRKFGFLPGVENACLQGNQAPSARRLDLWLRARVQVPARPDWFFIKLHTHGANEANMPVLLGDPMRRFHAALAERTRREPNFRFHYVTAREMVNVVHLASTCGDGPVDPDAGPWASPFAR